MFQLTVNNYRSFIQQDFDFKRINIIIGENSSGKSSLLKLFLLLKQTMNNPNDANLVLNGDFVDLGNYRETVYYQKSSKNIAFKFAFGKEYLPYFLSYIFGREKNQNGLPDKETKYLESILTKADKEPTSLRYEVTKELHLHSTINTTIENQKIGTLKIVIKTEPEERERVLLRTYPICRLEYTRKEDGKLYVFDDIDYVKDGFMSIIMAQGLENQTKRSRKIFYEIAFLLITQNYLEDELGKMQFINPLNNVPKRIYFQKDTKMNYKNSDLEKLVGYVDGGKVSSDFLKTFYQILVDFGIADDIKVIGNKNLAVLELRVKIKDLLSNIIDVGYGVSLQLPILFEIFNAERHQGKTFLIEQPEVHLHPKLQAKFIEVLLKMGRKNSYFIETHSEHIVRMLQVIVKNKKYGISAKDVSIYYCKRVNKKTEVTRHDITSDGYLSTPFPEGFFDTSYTLAKELLF